MGLIGGGLKKSVEKIFPSYNFIHVFFLMLFVIILKMLLVKYSYNEVFFVLSSLHHYSFY